MPGAGEAELKSAQWQIEREVGDTCQACPCWMVACLKASSAVRRIEREVGWVFSSAVAAAGKSWMGVRCVPAARHISAAPLRETYPACCLLHRFQVHAPNPVCLPLLLPQNAGDTREAMALASGNSWL